MNNKLLQFDKEARQSILRGVTTLAKAVGSTLGPKGQCVVIDDYADGKPLITKDGVTVARNIQLKDKFENIGCQIAKEASLSTVSIVGDGTTTSVVLAEAFINAAELLMQDGFNPIEIKNQLELLKEDIINTIKSQSIPIKEGDIEKVATISANNDTEIGKLIGEAFQKIGLDGVITVEESTNTRTYVDITTGMQFERGYESPMFATDMNKGTCLLEKPYILLTDRKIQLMKEIVPLLEIANKNSRSILIIAQDYDDEVIQNLKINKQRGILKVCAVKAPSYGEYRKSLLEDLAILTGGQVITYESGLDFAKCNEKIFGSCDKVIVTRDNTTIFNGSGNPELIELRCNQLKQELENLPDSLDQDFLKEFNALRIARLKGGVCIIKVGGTTDLEMRERKDRIDDAVCATKAATEEGIVVGGGVSFMNTYYDLYSKYKSNPIQFAILESLGGVQKKIMQNSGVDILDVDISKIEKNFGFNAATMKWENLLDAGIINPAKVDRCAFENAFSVLNMYLSANTLIVNEEIIF